MTDLDKQKYLESRYYSGISDNKSLIGKIKRLVYFRFASNIAKGTKKAIIKTMKGMGQEAHETKKMARLFFRLLSSKLDLENRKTPPSAEEVKEALEQLKDVGRFSVFASISILPGGGFSLIAIELLARRFGIKNFTFIPSAFREKLKEEKENKIP